MSESVKILIADAILDPQNGDPSAALTHLNLVNKQLTGADLGIAAAQSTQNQEFVLWENDGMKIVYPSDWKKEEYYDANVRTIVQFSSPATPRVYIEVFELPASNITLDEYSKQTIDGLKSFMARERVNFDIIESSDVTLAGYPAHQIVYTQPGFDPNNSSEQFREKGLNIWTLKNGNAYAITYVAAESEFAHFSAIAQKMLDSFELTG